MISINNITKFTVVALISIITIGCSPALKVLDSWTKEGPNLLKDKSVLVITRTKDNKVRVASEKAIQSELEASKVKAKTSFNLFPILNPNKKLNQEEIESTVNKIKQKGFKVVILTALKKYDETVYTEHTGGYYAGGKYYGAYISGFESYYGTTNQYMGAGVYVPSETKTTISKRYVLETVVYNLNLPINKQLISVTTTEIEDPDNINGIINKYAKKVVRKILKN